MSQVKVLSVNISDRKGVVKKPVGRIELSSVGVCGDAHQGKWHRMVSLLGTESIHKFEHQAKRKINFGEFAENITTEGVILYETKPLDRFVNENVELEVTQIGKECHGDSCAIYREVGNCVMPKEGIFARVIKGGFLSDGEILNYIPKKHKFHVITLSDRAFNGEYSDRSGPELMQLLSKFAADHAIDAEITYSLLADDSIALKEVISEKAELKYDLIITCGGTGISDRDITVDVVRPLLTKEIPGIMEMIRWKYGVENPSALLSRGISGLIKNTQIFTFPGSVKACKEYSQNVLPHYFHILNMVHGIDKH